MSRRPFGLLVGLAFMAGCSAFIGDCPRSAPAPAPERSYLPELGRDGIPVHDATLDVGATTATLEYTAPDGTRWRARYTIVARESEL